MEPRRVYKAAYRSMTMAGVDRRMLFLALMLGAVVFYLFNAFIGGIGVGVLTYVAARMAQRYDPQLFDVVLAGRGQRSVYCAAKREDVKGRW